MVTLDLHYVDELIAVRQVQHGGGQGAPAIIDGHRVGASINRSCIVMLSALLQSFVEDVFVAVSTEKLGMVGDAIINQYRKSFSRWGNPSEANIRALFNRLGVADVLDGLSWRGLRPGSVHNNLCQMNELRNQIAHGRRDLRLNGNPYSLSLAKAAAYRNFVRCLSERFEAHARIRVGLLA